MLSVRSSSATFSALTMSATAENVIEQLQRVSIPSNGMLTSKTTKLLRTAFRQKALAAGISVRPKGVMSNTMKQFIRDNLSLVRTKKNKTASKPPHGMARKVC